jgi:hypothetical protein
VSKDLGFPAIQVKMYAHVRSWDASVYNGICQFQKAKGFDPYSQEVAIQLGYPLLELSHDIFAHSKPRIIASILL